MGYPSSSRERMPNAFPESERKPNVCSHVMRAAKRINRLCWRKFFFFLVRSALGLGFIFPLPHTKLKYPRCLGGFINYYWPPFPLIFVLPIFTPASRVGKDLACVAFTNWKYTRNNTGCPMGKSLCSFLLRGKRGCHASRRHQ